MPRLREYTLMVQIKFTTNKVDVLQRGTFFQRGGGKNLKNFDEKLQIKVTVQRFFRLLMNK